MSFLKNDINLNFAGKITFTCTDMPNFKDRWGTTCEQTMKFGNCKDGKPVKYSAAELRKDANSDGISVMDACCGCYENYGSINCRFSTFKNDILISLIKFI